MTNYPYFALLPAQPDLELIENTIKGDLITLIVHSRSSQVLCPLCQELTCRIHSYYQRTLADLPWAGFKVRLQLQVRRFFCLNPECKRKIFSERLHQLTKA